MVARSRCLAQHPDAWPPDWRESWQRFWSSGAATVVFHPFRDAAAVNSRRAYEHQIDHALIWAQKCGHSPVALIDHDEVIVAMRDAMIAGGSSPATIRLRLIALQGLAKAIGSRSDNSVYRRLLRMTPRRTHSSPACVGHQVLFKRGIAALELVASNPADVATAIAFRRGLVVAFLALVPLRLHELVALCWFIDMTTVDASMPRLEKRGQRYVVIVPPKRRAQRRLKMRSRRVARNRFGGGKDAAPFIEVPDELTKLVTIYLTVYRPLLVGTGTDDGAAWMSDGGARLGRLQMYRDIRRVARVNPHAFRSAYATALDLGGVEADNISRMLGNSSTVTYDHYVQRPPEITGQIAARNIAHFNALLNSDVRQEPAVDPKEIEDGGEGGD